MHVNNETGVIQPVAELAEKLQRTPTYLHVDAAQGYAKVPEDLKAPIDLTSISGHKIGAPKGIGALVTRRRGWDKVPLEPIMFGGGQERKLRPERSRATDHGAVRSSQGLPGEPVALGAGREGDAGAAARRARKDPLPDQRGCRPRGPAHPQCDLRRAQRRGPDRTDQGPGGRGDRFRMHQRLVHAEPRADRNGPPGGGGHQWPPLLVVPGQVSGFDPDGLAETIAYMQPDAP
ncbi:aminotransferase class V-fold PLP-dependent enzyme [Streptomyces sp. INA 01156]